MLYKKAQIGAADNVIPHPTILSISDYLDRGVAIV